MKKIFTWLNQPLEITVGAAIITLIVYIGEFIESIEKLNGLWK